MKTRAAATAGRVLVLGDYRQTVTVVRSLGRAGFEVTLGTQDRRSSTAWSRHLFDVWVYDNSSVQRFNHNVEAFLRSERPDYVFAVGESQLRRILEVAERLEPLATWANPDFATVARCFDKRAMYQLAAELGVPVMPWTAYTSAEDWRVRARDMGYPVVVKRKDSAGPLMERKALVCRSAEQFESFLVSLQRESDTASLVLQKFAPGARHNCHIGAADGRLVAYFQQKVLRTDEPDETGIGVAGVSVPPSPRLRAHCEALTGALLYTGIGCIQFLVDDASGSVAFLEFNARMDSTAALPYRMGFDYPLLAVELAAYRKARDAARADAERLLPAAHAEHYPAGKTYHWLLGDLNTWLGALRARRGSLSALAAHASHMMWLALRSYHLTFDWRDPLPALHMFWRRFVKDPLRRRVPLARPLPR